VLEFMQDPAGAPAVAEAMSTPFNVHRYGRKTKPSTISEVPF
jgi:hypothetical protein